MKHAVRVYPGSICSGSHREEDLWKAIRGYVPNSIPWKIIGDDLYYWLTLEVDSLTWEEEQEIRYQLNELINNEAWDYMNSIAPEGHYFGAHPGDGADFGFWPIEEDEELPAYTDLGGYPLYYLDRFGYVLCPDCANDREPGEKKDLENQVNWEEPYLYCYECSQQIEPAYEPEELEELERLEKLEELETV